MAGSSWSRPRRFASTPGAELSCELNTKLLGVILLKSWRASLSKHQFSRPAPQPLGHPSSTPSRRGGRPTAQPESLVQRWANAVGGRAADVLYPLFLWLLWHDASIVGFGMNICDADIPVLSPVGIVGFIRRSIQLPAGHDLALGHPGALVFRGQRRSPGEQFSRASSYYGSMVAGAGLEPATFGL